VAYEGSLVTVGGVVSYNINTDSYEMYNPKYIFSGGLRSLKALNDKINGKYKSIVIWGSILGICIAIYLSLRL